MKIFVINCGSSSIKYQLFDMADESVLAKGLLERLGTEEVCLQHEGKGRKVKPTCSAKDHKTGLELIIKCLVDSEYGVIGSIDEIDAVGHRVVHGGEEFSGSVLIDEQVAGAIERCAQLAPLHNPPNLAGIAAAQASLSSAAQVAVFDTAFHSTLEKRAFVYALPYEWYKSYGIRRYGFHGTSHQYVAQRAAEILDKELGQLNLITAHMGNGCSITAIRKGKSTDTSMGLTPVEGLVMGTRGGDMDPAIIFHLEANTDMSLADIGRAMQKDSGLLGISGLSNDMRDIIEAYQQGNEQAKLAFEIFVYRLKKYIGSYMAALGHVDGLVFTGGIGENSTLVRQKALENMEAFGLELDTAVNEKTVKGKQGLISTADGKVKILVIPTNEELLIARQTLAMVSV